MVLTGSRKSQYETRFREWGFRKYSKGTRPNDWKIVSYKVDKAKRLGKEARVYRLGKPVTPKVLRTQGFLKTLELKAFEQGELLINLRCFAVLDLTITLTLQHQHLRPHQISASACPLLHQEADVPKPLRLRLNVKQFPNNGPNLPIPTMEQQL